MVSQIQLVGHPCFHPLQCLKCQEGALLSHLPGTKSTKGDPGSHSADANTQHPFLAQPPSQNIPLSILVGYPAITQPQTPALPSPGAFPRTLQREIHNARIQSIHLRAHVHRHVREVRGASYGVVGQGAVAHVGQGVQRRRLCGGWGVGGEASLGLELVVQGEGLQGQRHDGLGLELGHGDAAQGGPLGLCLFAGPPAALGSVRDQLVQLLCPFQGGEEML